MGYKGVETTELHFDNFPVPANNLIGGTEGLGLGKQVMAGMEIERLERRSPGLGVARAAFEEAIRYAQRNGTHSANQLPSINRFRSSLRTWPPGSRHRSSWFTPAAAKRDRGEALRRGSGHGETVCH